MNSKTPQNVPAPTRSQAVLNRSPWSEFLVRKPQGTCLLARVPYQRRQPTTSLAEPRASATTPSRNCHRPMAVDVFPWFFTLSQQMNLCRLCCSFKSRYNTWWQVLPVYRSYGLQFVICSVAGPFFALGACNWDVKMHTTITGEAQATTSSAALGSSTSKLIMCI